MNYNEELDKYISNFFNKLSNSFELAPTPAFAKYSEEKTITQFGYKINTIQTIYDGEQRHLREFPFKWGFNDEFIAPNTNFGPDEYYVASPKMEAIVQKTIDEQEAFFNSIIANLLLQDYFAVLETDPESRVQRLIQLPAVTKANSSVFGSIDYIEYIFHLVLYKDNPQR